jgi:hypothetical protein
MSQPFLDAIFKGARFDGSELPVDLLQELEAYRDLLLAVARHIYLDQHRDRQRVPRGFAESLKLTLSGIQEGSTVAVLSRQVPAQPELADWGADTFEPAREKIGEVLAAANSGTPLPAGFPTEVLRKFNRLGKRLMDSDSIEFRPSGASTGPKFTIVTKRRLLSSLQDEIEVAYIGYARLAGASDTRCAVDLTLPSGRDVEGRAGEDVLDAAAKVMPDRKAAWLRVSGTASVDNYDRVMKLTELEDLEVVDEEYAVTFDKVQTRIDELATIQNGWLDGEGVGLVERNTSWVRDSLFLVIGELSLPKPGVFPTPEGHIQAEWILNKNHLTLLFNLDDPGVEVEVFDAESDLEETETFKRSEGDSIVEYIKQHRGGAGA